MVFKRIVKFRINTARELEDKGLIQTQIFTLYGQNKISDISSYNKMLALHRSIKDSINQRERDFLNQTNYYSLYNLGPFVENKIRVILKNTIKLDYDNVEIFGEIPSRFLNSDSSLINLGTIPEPTKNTNEEEILDKVENMTKVIKAGIEKKKFMVGYYETE